MSPRRSTFAPVAAETSPTPAAGAPAVRWCRTPRVEMSASCWPGVMPTSIAREASCHARTNLRAIEHARRAVWQLPCLSSRCSLDGTREGCVPIGRLPCRSLDSSPTARRSDRVRPRGRQELDRDHYGRQEIDQRDRHPHQGAGEFLVVERCKTREPRGRKVRGVYDAIAEYEKRGQCVARQRRRKQVHRDQPGGRTHHTRPPSNDRKPE